ncbi:ActS/PrrB/RegB family redox-sensitive histidine kinase [Thioclava litoralis]|uniref:histidine kinase n=1 Tax=Thioclava litoralis TaxID=3076557 RepID=A0ABZ1DV06_9RHOB|nr:ActS/PrrB/RegB family redox-sensitive histidine kinase [Thioclava sp. FTW29]
MSGFETALPVRGTTSHEWVRLRTLTFLRWMAIIGQLMAILVAWFLLEIGLNLVWCLATVGASVLVNLLALFLTPESRRLSHNAVLALLLFDTAQLAVLLLLTGGLNNPFALLILVPTTIAATTLEWRATMLIGVVTVVLTTFVAGLYVPLVSTEGEVIQLPALFEFGYWTAIVIGVVFLGAYAQRISNDSRVMSEALLAAQLALSREQKLTDLGGVVAAAAHELGTPLATIKLVSSELADELSDNEELREDALLIRAQADRCRDILRSMGRAGKDDLHLRTAPLISVLREAAEPHMDRGKEIIFTTEPIGDGSDKQPAIYRYPELIHALRNLVQNAVDFAASKVWVDALWSGSTIVVRVCDDGRGYAPDVIGRIGDPFLHGRNSTARKEYEGMGLGLFIAKTLLERTGARITFRNGTTPFVPADRKPERSGAIVELAWPIERLLAPEREALGENVPIES